MRILLVHTYHYLRGGDARYTFSLRDLLKKKGHDVYFLGMQHPKNEPCQEGRYFVDYIDFVEMNQKKSFLNSVKVLNRSIYYKDARNKIRRMINELKPDVVHLQNIHSHITPSILFEIKNLSLPVFWTMHDYKLICPNSHFIIDKTGEICQACLGGKYFHPIFKKCKKNSILPSFAASIEAYTHKFLNITGKVDLFLSPSDFLKNKLLESGIKEKKVKKLRYFLSNDYYAKNTSDSGYVLFYGRIERIKGILDLLQAIKRTPNIHLVIAGNISQNIQKEFDSNLSQNVSYVGFKSGNDLKELIKNSKFVVVPSIWYENQPFSILESFACGKPVISCNLGGMKELIGDDERGLLIPPGNPDALAKAITDLFFNKNMLLDLGNNAYEYVCKNHSEEEHYKAIMDVYKFLA